MTSTLHGFGVPTVSDDFCPTRTEQNRHLIRLLAAADEAERDGWTDSARFLRDSHARYIQAFAARNEDR